MFSSLSLLQLTCYCSKFARSLDLMYEKWSPSKAQLNCKIDLYTLQVSHKCTEQCVCAHFLYASLGKKAVGWNNRRNGPHKHRRVCASWLDTRSRNSSYEYSRPSKKSWDSSSVAARPCSYGEILIEARIRILPALTALQSTNDWSILSSGAKGHGLHSHSVPLGLAQQSVPSSSTQA